MRLKNSYSFYRTAKDHAAWAKKQARKRARLSMSNKSDISQSALTGSDTPKPIISGIFRAFLSDYLLSVLPIKVIAAEPPPSGLIA